MPDGVAAASLELLLLLLPDEGDEVVVVFVVLLLDELPPPAGEGFTMVVLCSAGEAPPAAGVTSVRCSQAPRSAALARMQIIFFIVLNGLVLVGQSLIALQPARGLA